MATIIPAILATTEEQFKQDLQKIESAESLKNGWLHLDLADGQFVPNRTINVNIVKNHPTDLKIEAHLMVKDPSSFINSLKEVGVKKVIAHIECGEEQIDDFIASCRALNLKVGLAIKTETDLAELESYWDEIDLVLIMSIDPGFQGQPFKEQALDKIKEVSDIKKTSGFRFTVAVDGHVDDQNAKLIVDAGADQLVSGSYLLKGDINENLEKIQQKLK